MAWRSLKPEGSTSKSRVSKHQARQLVFWHQSPLSTNSRGPASGGRGLAAKGAGAGSVGLIGLGLEEDPGLKTGSQGRVRVTEFESLPAGLRL